MVSHLILPVSRLYRSDLAAIHTHFLKLNEADRSQRFGLAASDAAIAAYVDGLRFDQDAFFGVWDEQDDSLLGFTHLAISPVNRYAEIGVSVHAAARRRGLGSAMLDQAIDYALRLELTEVVMCFQPYNTELMQLARTHGMRLSVGNGEGLARLGLVAR
ncbi:GNAT family N-acetyltransferase [Chitinimonas sp. BJYL2]|uniref:GNAT family N-acetyltransferase n=1 Tax=Chitinimonas sp. BJYL2 TaxID=2976696 RepID=UPI0022B3BB08|nr:GNAT family N-acetyltransferase [Chitinimonas sp. BJYL2]